MYRGHQPLFSLFALPNSLSAVTRELGLVLMFCASELIFGGTEGNQSNLMFCTPENDFGGTEGVGSSFHVLRSRTRFGR
jgi:ABC-type sulfate transport system permease subunit